MGCVIGHGISRCHARNVRVRGRKGGPVLKFIYIKRIGPLI